MHRGAGPLPIGPRKTLNIYQPETDTIRIVSSDLLAEHPK